MKEKNEFWLQVYGFVAQIALCAVGLLVIGIIGILSGALTIGKYASGGALLYWLFH